MKVCLSPTRVLSVPQAGGYEWIFLNWALGLQANGCEIVWLERRPAGLDAAELKRRVAGLLAHFDQVGLDARIALFPEGDAVGAGAEPDDELAGLTVPWEAAVEESDLLLNFLYSLDPSIVERFRRSVLVDIDPGLTQIWIGEGQIDLTPHDLHVSVGENLDGPAPGGGLRWHHVPPPVYLPAWPVTASEPSDPYTTVTNWSSGEWVVTREHKFPNDKRRSFLEYADLAERVDASLELAICLSRSQPQDAEDRALLEARGWRVRHAWEVTGTPLDYRRYVQESRGEFSCAKPSYARMANAWVSDRTVCYLASGKPVVVQHTGPSAFLPEDEGMFRFRDLAGAARALEDCEADYARHGRAARALAEEFLDARRLTGRVLELAEAASPGVPA